MADQIAAPALVRELCALPAAAGPTVLAVDRDLPRVFDIDDATKVKLAGDAVADIGKGLRDVRRRQRGAVRDGAVALRGARAAAAPVADRRGGGRRARSGWSSRTTSAPSCGRTSTRPRCACTPSGCCASTATSWPARRCRRVPPSDAGAAGTLALIERLLAEKDQPGYVLFSPGPVMTSARVKAALVHHDVCHRDGDYSAVVGAAAGEAAAGVRRLAGARDDPADRLGDLGDGDGDLVGGAAGQEDPGHRQRRVRRPARRDRGAARHPARHAPLRLGRAAERARRGARAGERPRHRGGGDDPARDLGRAHEPDRRDRAALPRSAA